MNKKLISLLCILGAIILLLLIMLQYKGKKINTGHSSSKIGAKEEDSIKNIDPIDGEGAPLGLTQKEWDLLVAVQRERIKRNSEINFYGKVIDQFGHAIEDVEITINRSIFNETFIDDIKKSQTAEGTESLKVIKKIIYTNKEGEFFLENVRGINLEIRSYEKVGFTNSDTSIKSFDFTEYDQGGAIPVYSTKESPFILKLWKNGELQNIERDKVRLKFDANGTRNSLSLFSKKLDEKKELIFYVKVESDLDNTSNKNRKYNWSIYITLKNGMIAEAEDEFFLEAPETGYRKFFEVANNRDSDDWGYRITDKVLYIYCADSQMYGKLNLTVYTYNDGMAMVEIDGIVNPSGSRSLQP